MRYICQTHQVSAEVDPARRAVRLILPPATPQGAAALQGAGACRLGLLAYTACEDPQAPVGAHGRCQVAIQP
jgi:hypothetical protein